MEVYQELYWEVFDPQTARVVAHFFSEGDADQYSEWLNSKRTCVVEVAPLERLQRLVRRWLP